MSTPVSQPESNILLSEIGVLALMVGPEEVSHW